MKCKVIRLSEWYSDIPISRKSDIIGTSKHHLTLKLSITQLKCNILAISKKKKRYIYYT